MPNYGTLNGIVISNVITAESKEIAETVTGQSCVELPITDVGIGWTYESGTFSAPVKPEPITSVNTKPTA
jgi:hypothetical protein